MLEARNSEEKAKLSTWWRGRRWSAHVRKPGRVLWFVLPRPWGGAGSEGRNHVVAFYLLPRNVLYNPSTPPTRKQSMQHNSTEWWVWPQSHQQRFAQWWLIRYKMYLNFVPHWGMRIWHKILRDRLTGLSFLLSTKRARFGKSWILSYAEYWPGKLNLWLQSYNGIYSAVTAFVTGNPKEPYRLHSINHVICEPNWLFWMWPDLQTICASDIRPRVMFLQQCVNWLVSQILSFCKIEFCWKFCDAFILPRYFCFYLCLCGLVCCLTCTHP